MVQLENKISEVKDAIENAELECSQAAKTAAEAGYPNTKGQSVMQLKGTLLILEAKLKKLDNQTAS